MIKGAGGETGEMPVTRSSMEGATGPSTALDGVSVQPTLDLAGRRGHSANLIVFDKSLNE